MELEIELRDEKQRYSAEVQRSSNLHKQVSTLETHVAVLRAEHRSHEAQMRLKMEESINQTRQLLEERQKLQSSLNEAYKLHSVMEQKESELDLEKEAMREQVYCGRRALVVLCCTC